MDPGNMLKQSQKQGRKRKQSARFQWVDTKGATASHVCGTARHGTCSVLVQTAASKSAGEAVVCSPYHSLYPGAVC